MTHLDPTQQAVLAIGLTLLAGLLLACAVCFSRHGIPRRPKVQRPRRVVGADLGIDVYEQAAADRADDAIFAWSAAAWAEFDLIGRGRVE